MSVAEVRAPAADPAADLLVPPHSTPAEQALLGAALLAHAATWDDLAVRVRAGDFYRREHRLIWGAIEGLTERAEPVDVVTVAESLEAGGTLEDAGGLAYIYQLAKEVPSTSNAIHYAELVARDAALRALIGVGEGIRDRAYARDGELDDQLGAADAAIGALVQARAGPRGPKAVRELLREAVELVEDLYAREDPVTGLPTGYLDLDLLTSGLHPGQLVVVAGRPSMGKTAFALGAAAHAAELGRAVLGFSLEMPGRDLTLRLLAARGIDLQRLRRGRLEDDDWPKLTAGVHAMAQWPLAIDDSPGVSVAEVRARARAEARSRGGLGLVVIDYLQLLRGEGRAENRVLEVSAMTRALKVLAGELGCPVMVLSQLNRELERRPNKRPVMSDLRESGAIEQDADVIVFLYRDEVYAPASPDQGMAEAIVAKQRNGPIGTVRLAFQGAYTRFANLAARDAQP